MGDQDSRLSKAMELAAGSFRCSAQARQMLGEGRGLRRLALRLGLQSRQLMDEVMREARQSTAPSPTPNL